MAKDENDEVITQYKVADVRMATLETLLTIMHINCGKCKDENPVSLLSGDILHISCLTS